MGRSKECNDSLLQLVILIMINLGCILYNCQVNDSHWADKAWTQKAASSGATDVSFSVLISCSESV